MSLPSLHLRTADLSGPWVQQLGDPLDAVLDKNAHKYMWVSLQAEREKGGVGHLAMSTPWWEMAARESDVLPFVVSTPGHMTEAQYLTHMSNGATTTIGPPLPPVRRSNYKWLSKLYLDPTDKSNRFTRKYMGEFGQADFQPEALRRCFSGEFQIVEPIKMLVDWHTRPLSYMGMMIAREKANGEFRAISPEIYGPPAQLIVAPDTPAPEAQIKVPYICIVGIDAICGSKRTRMCGSMYYYDAVDQPYEHKTVINALMQTCPYDDIGKEMAGAPGSRLYMESMKSFNSPQI